MARTTQPDPVVPVRKLVAISYARVSTGPQAAEDRSGMERQEQAIAAWLQAHPAYELDREVRHVGSGAKAGRFEWFITELQEGRLPQGACLVVEKLSRFSREPVSDVLQTLLQLWSAGGAIACCELGGHVLDQERFNSQSGDAFVLVGAIQRARGEWEERRDRKLGSDRRKQRLIAEGQKPFRSRRRGAAKAAYPFWLDFSEKSGTFTPNTHAAWVQQVFLWAQEAGSTTIARRLREQGVRCPTDRRKAISMQRVVNLLKDRAVLGERQQMDAKRQPVGDPVPGVFPPIVTPQEWELARAAVESRHAGHVTTGAKRHNLFEDRIFCIRCGGRLGVFQQKRRLSGGVEKVYAYLRCNTWHKDHSACPMPVRPYQEAALLDQLKAFQWADYFSDRRHDEQLQAARRNLLSWQAASADLERQLQNVRQTLLRQARAGAALAAALSSELERLAGEHSEAMAGQERARAALDALQRRRSGKDAERAIRGRVQAFLAESGDDLDQRMAFNRWLHTERLLIACDLSTDQVWFGVGTLEGGLFSQLSVEPATRVTTDSSGNVTVAGAEVVVRVP